MMNPAAITFSTGAHRPPRWAGMSDTKKKGRTEPDSDVRRTAVSNAGSRSNSKTQPVVAYSFHSTESGVRDNASSTGTKFRRDEAPTQAGEPTSSHLHVAKTLSAKNEAMSWTLKTRRRSPSLPSLYTYGVHALSSTNSPFATSGSSSDMTYEGRSRRLQKEMSRSNAGVRKSASVYFPQPSSSSSTRQVRPSTSPTTSSAAASFKPKMPFITIKWLMKRRDRKDSNRQETTVHSEADSYKTAHSHCHSEEGTYTFPNTPVSSGFDTCKFPSTPSSSEFQSHMQDTRVSLIIDHADVSDSELEEEDRLPSHIPMARKDKLQRLLLPYDSHTTQNTRPLLHLNLSFARPRPQPHQRESESDSPATLIYDEKDGWCIDDRYLSTADGDEDEEDDDDGGGITPVSDIVFGDRPPSPTKGMVTPQSLQSPHFPLPPQEKEMGTPQSSEREMSTPQSSEKEMSTPQSSEKEMCTPQSSPQEKEMVTLQSPQSPPLPPPPPPLVKEIVTSQSLQPPSLPPRAPSPTIYFSPSDTPLHFHPKCLSHEEEEETSVVMQDRRMRRRSSYSLIYSRATSPTPGLWSVLDSREVATEMSLGPWVGYWNRGSLQEVLAELRELR